MNMVKEGGKNPHKLNMSNLSAVLISLRGEGGPASKMKILCFVICCSPSFGVSKMGSFVSELQAFVEIQHDNMTKHDKT